MWSRSNRSSGDEVHLPSPERANLPNRRGREAPGAEMVLRPPHPACLWQRLEPKSPKSQFRAFLLPLRLDRGRNGGVMG